MSRTDATGGAGNGVSVSGFDGALALDGAPVPGLPGQSGTPTDPLAEMIALSCALAEMSVAASEERLNASQKEWQKALVELVERIKKAQEKKHESHGLFGGILNAVTDLVGRAVGNLVEVRKDIVMLPVGVGKALVCHGGDSSELLRALEQEVTELGREGDWAKDIRGFTRGTLNMTARTIVQMYRVALSPHMAVATGQSWQEVLQQEKEGFLRALDQEILQNAAFFRVAEPLAKVTAATVAVASGGTLTMVAVGMMLLCELDQRTKLLDSAFDERTAFGIRLGLEVGAATLLVLSAVTSEGTVTALRGMSSAMQGANSTCAALKTYAEGRREARELEKSADIQESLAVLERFAQCVDELLELVSEKTDYRERTVRSSCQLTEIDGQTQVAALVRG